MMEGAMLLILITRGRDEFNQEDVVVTKFDDNQQPDKMDIESDCSTPAFCSNEKEKNLSNKAGVITPTLGAPIPILLTFDAAVDPLLALNLSC
ncbi:hypothetical protein Tco_1157270 [Tanacetum coccineum]